MSQAHRWVPRVVALVQTAFVLGPALGPGVVIAYDMPWSPDPRWTPFVLGQDTPAPRVVPSDAIAVLVGKVVGAGLAQVLILGSILIGLALGAAALSAQVHPRIGLTGRVCAVVAAVWNPFVIERLGTGQWVIVLGLAVLALALRASVRVVHGTDKAYAVLLPVAMSGLGGVNSVVIVMAGVMPVLVGGAIWARSRQVVVAGLAALAVAGAVSAVWLVPSLRAPVPVARGGVDAFAPVADTPLGVWGSLLSGGGMWNVASHPVSRSGWLIALTATALAVLGAVGAGRMLRGTSRLLWAPALLGLGIVALSRLGAARTLWLWVVTEVPGGGVLRDSHKMLAAWVLLIAVGLALVVDWVVRTRPEPFGALAATAIVGAVAIVAAPLGWGVSGRLSAVEVPGGYRSAMTLMSTREPGPVGVLPWSQYRRYAWNDSRISLTLGPRIINQRVLFDDSLPLRSGRIPGEDPRAAAVTRSMADGMSAVSALRRAGMRYLVLEKQAGLPVDEPQARAAGRVLVENDYVLVVDMGPVARP